MFAHEVACPCCVNKDATDRCREYNIPKLLTVVTCTPITLVGATTTSKTLNRVARPACQGYQTCVLVCLGLCVLKALVGRWDSSRTMAGVAVGASARISFTEDIVTEGRNSSRSIYRRSGRSIGARCCISCRRSDGCICRRSDHVVASTLCRSCLPVRRVHQLSL